MEHSLSEQLEVTCATCGRKFGAEIWFIVDTVQRPGLLERIRRQSLHSVTCPNGHISTPDVPLLLYRPGETYPILFSPAEGASNHLTNLHRRNLIRKLRELDPSLTEQDTSLVLVSRQLLPAVLTEGVDPTFQRLRELLALFIWADTLPAARRVVEVHPELLTSNAALMLSQWIAAHPDNADPRFLQVLKERRTLLMRFREDGLENVVGAGTTENEGAGEPHPIDWMQTLPPDQRRALGAIVANAKTPDELEAALDANPELRSAGLIEEALTVALQTAQSPVPAELTEGFRKAANALEHFQRIGDQDALAQALADCRQILAHPGLSASPERFRALVLSAAGAAFIAQHQVGGRSDDLEQAIACWEQSLRLTSVTMAESAGASINLAIALRARYRETNTLSDLDQAITYGTQAVNLVRVSSSPPAVWAHHLSVLGNSLQERYVRIGNKPDLDQAIACQEEAVGLTASSPDAAYLSNLGLALRERYTRTGDLADLDQAVRCCRQAVDLTPPPRPARSNYVNNLGLGLLDQYNRTGEPADLEESIRRFQEAVDLTPATSSDRAGYLANLASGLHSRYGLTADLASLDQAISSIEQAIDLAPAASLNQIGFVASLGVALHDRYGRTGDLADLNRAIDHKQQAVDLTSKASPESPMYLGNLAAGLRDRHTRAGEVGDLRAATRAFRQACIRGLAIRPEQTLRISGSWGIWALERAAWKEAAKAYGFGLQAVERLLSVQLLRASKESWLRDAQELHTRAAYALARSGALPLAVVTLEMGRARLLVESMELMRTDVAHLSAIGHDELYQLYVSAADRIAQLEAAELRRERRPPVIDLVAELRRARRQLDTSIEAIRRVPGYGDFFRPPDFEAIRKCLTTGIAEHSPTAATYLLVTPIGGLALIIHCGGVELLPLEFSTEDLDNLLLKRDGERLVGGYLPAQLGLVAHEQTLEETLSKLGTQIMGPLAAALKGILGPAESNEGGADRLVLLIPTGCLALLPLHAASYEKGGKEHAFLDEYTVAYVPSARVLSSCREALTSLANGPPALVAVGNPLPLNDVARPLVFGRAEAEEVSAFFEGRTELLCEGKATRNDVQQAMRNGTYLHFACHGKFELADPLSSGVILANGERLALVDLYTGPMFKGTRLAVLSACQTAITDFKELPEEAIGLPAGFLRAGVPAVIGSLWPVDDLSTTLLMSRLYDCHFRGDPHANTGPMPIAHALRRAQIWLRDVTGEELSDIFDIYRNRPPGRPGIPQATAQEKFIEYTLRPPGWRPFERPYYWAAFALYGI